MKNEFSRRGLWARSLAALAVATVALGSPALAREEAPAYRHADQKLPPDATTGHIVDLPGRTLRYTVTAGSLPLADPQGKLLVEIAYVAYVLDGHEPQTRPITFAFNGGPGAASAYLHFGALGPKRHAFGNEGDTPSNPPVLVDNAETWLDFTDLVFIDPVGTGYSRFANDSDDLRRQFWSVDGDVRGLSRVIAKYLEKNGRLASKKFLAGESYGGFRTPKLANRLQSDEGIGVSGLVLVSPVIDFQVRADGATSVLPIAAKLPSYAAARLERDGVLDRAKLAEAERYAGGDYIVDLLRGPRDREAVERMTKQVAALTGLDPALVRRLGGRVDARTFARALHRDRQRIGSAYDANVTSSDPYPSEPRSRYEDPVLDAATAPLTATAMDYLGRTLNWKADGRYNLLNGEVSRRWNWGGGLDLPEAVGDLRKVLALDGKLNVVVAHGFTDLVTPYLESKFVLDQLPAMGDAERVRLEVFPGGHMFYTRQGSRDAFRESVKRLYDAAAG